MVRRLEDRVSPAAGMLDPTFGVGGKVITRLAISSEDEGRATAADSLGRIIIAGATYNGSSFDFAIVRYTTAGSLDPTFGGTGIVTIDFTGSHDEARAVAVDSQNRILVGGFTENGSKTDFAVARLTTAGTLDATFDGDGKQTIAFGASDDLAYAIAADSLNRVVIAGQTGTNNDFAVARLTTGGALDITFDGDGKQTIAFGAGGDQGRGVAVDSLDRVVVAGETENGLNYDFAVARLTVGGTLDASFDVDGKQTIDFGTGDDLGEAVAVDSLDRVIVSGITNNNSDFGVARLTAGGAIDNSFDGDGKQTIDFGSSNDEAIAVAVDTQDRVVAAGFTLSGPGFSFAVARLTVAGALDSSFNGDGKQVIAFGGDLDFGNAVAVDSLNRVLVAGYTNNGSENDFAVARLTGDTTTAAAQVNEGSVQRSRVTSLTVRFSGQVAFSGMPEQAFTLIRTGGVAVNFTATVSVQYGGTVVVLGNFSGPETEFSSLRDGRYTLTTLASQISSGGQALDGDANGTAGGDFVFGDAQGLYRFFGDINGDRHVDIADFGIFSQSIFNAANYIAAFDFNDDGHVDIQDFGQFSVRLFSPLP
jgi:uncharacterized delta-60 repeat protein